jgi:enoyl-CoA hydratase
MTQAASARDDSTVHVERRGAAGFIILDRPRALNALTLPMVRAIAAALDDFEPDARVAQVVIASAGGRAFCSGGDIRLFYELGRSGDHAAQLDFWREEYQLNRRIARYSKPCVALVDGIVMGGGVGLFAHASHRVVSERCLFAMPEVGIGFFPDVGAAYVLGRLPGRIGALLAATGKRIEAGDVVELAIAQTFVPSSDLPALTAALAEAGPIEAVLDRFAASPPPGKLAAEKAAIQTWFARFDRSAVLEALAKAPPSAELAAAALTAMRATSPTSQAIALRQVKLAADLSLEETLRLDFRIASRICRAEDMYEGVRATIVDKDHAPRWRPGPDEPIAEAAIDAYFAPLSPAEELTFPEPARR